jgi:hypothetical protein
MTAAIDFGYTPVGGYATTVADEVEWLVSAAGGGEGAENLPVRRTRYSGRCSTTRPRTPTSPPTRGDVVARAVTQMPRPACKARSRRQAAISQPESELLLQMPRGPCVSG